MHFVGLFFRLRYKKNAYPKKKQKWKITDQWNVSETFNEYFNTKFKNNLLNDYANSIDNHTHFMEQAFTKTYPTMERKCIFKKKWNKLKNPSQ